MVKTPKHVFRGIVSFRNRFSSLQILGLYHSDSDSSSSSSSDFEFQKLNDDENAHRQFSIDRFKRMGAIGDPVVDVYTTNIVIDCFCKLYRASESFAILADCFKRSIVPNVSTFNALLNGLVLEDRIMEAESLFKMLIEKKLCEPDVVMYNTMIKAVCKCKNSDKAIDLIELMDERGCKPNNITYNTVINCLCYKGMVEDALKLFNHMLFHEDILSSPSVLIVLVHGLCDFGHLDDAFELLNNLEEDERMSPDVMTYNILVNAFRKKGMMDDAENVLKIMIERRKRPNLSTYRSLIDGYCFRGEITQAKEVFDLLRIRGLNPDVATYNSLLNGYCDWSQVDDAIRLFHEITERGMKPNLITYNTMLDGLFRAKLPTYAWKLFDEMQTTHNLFPSECTYFIVLEGLCSNNQVDKALSIFHLMSDNKVKLETHMYNILIDGANKCGKPNISRILFSDLTVKGLYPDVKTYTVMISSFCEEGLVREAKELFQKMAKMGYLPNMETYNALLRGLLKNKEHDMIEMLLQEMDGHGFPLDYSILPMLRDLITSKSLKVDDTRLKFIRKEWRELFCVPF